MEIFKRMAKASQKIDAIGKDSRNDKQGFPIRSIDAIYNGVHEALAENEIFITTKIIKTIKEKEFISKSGNVGFYYLLEIAFTFYAPDGSNVESILWGEAIDYNDKAVNKCLSAAYKYALIQCFCIPTKEILADADKDSPEISPPLNHQRAYQKTPSQNDVIKKDVAQSKAVSNQKTEPIQPKSLAESLNSAIEYFQVKFGISVEELELHFGKPLDESFATKESIQKLRELGKHLAEGNKLSFPEKPELEIDPWLDEF